MRPLGIRQRILLAALAPALLVVVVQALLFTLDYRTTAFDNQHRRIEAVARQLAAAAEYEVFVDNREGLQRLLDSVHQEPDIVAAAYRSADGHLIVASPPGVVLPAPDDLIEGFAVSGAISTKEHWHVLPLRGKTAATEAIDLFSGIPESRNPPPGQLLLKVSMASLQGDLRKLAAQALAVSFGAMVLAMLLALLLSRGLIRTLDDIRNLVAGIGQGRHDQRITRVGADELGQLAEGINRMAEQVGQTQGQLEARVAAATVALREERDEATRAADSRGRFFAAASHDLRQPVQALGLFVAQLERDAGKSPLRPAIRKIGQVVRSLQDILDSLLNYSRLDGKVLQPAPRPVLAAEVIRQAVEAVAPLAAEKGLELRVRCPATAVWLLTDPILLHRILVNLIGNAVRHTRQGGVLVACRRQRHHALIAVWDTGPGIAPEHQQAIFEEFVQLDNPERDAGKGLGLGLAIVRRLADLLNHPLLLRSRVGRGSCFALHIPRAAGAPEADEGDERPRVLIFGPPREGSAELVDLLDRWDYRVDRVSDAHMLKDWISRHGLPDLLIHEAAPGSRDGTRQLREIEAEAGLIERLDQLEAETGLKMKVLFISDEASPPSLAQNQDMQWLTRPLQPARLRALVNRLLEPDDAA